MLKRKFEEISEQEEIKEEEEEEEEEKEIKEEEIIPIKKRPIKFKVTHTISVPISPIKIPRKFYAHKTTTVVSVPRKFVVRQTIEEKEKEEPQKKKQKILKQKERILPTPTILIPKKTIYYGNPKKYQILYVDPPWKYQNEEIRGNAKDKYPTMSDKELLNFNINQFADEKQCALIIWITSPKLDFGMELLKKWGFTHKTVLFTWIKTTKEGEPICGLGFYTRSSTEICLLGTRGKNMMGWKRSCNIKQVIFEQRREHSRKPEQAITRINELFIPELRKIEIFARTKRPGWDCWGNETNKFDDEIN